MFFGGVVYVIYLIVVCDCMIGFCGVVVVIYNLVVGFFVLFVCVFVGVGVL